MRKIREKNETKKNIFQKKMAKKRKLDNSGKKKKKKRKKIICTESGCTLQEKHMFGGIKGKCRSHEGYPLCNEPNCTKIIRVVEGGQKGKCGVHGGVPRCNEPSCTKMVCFGKGGKKGKCISHTKMLTRRPQIHFLNIRFFFAYFTKTKNVDTEMLERYQYSRTLQCIKIRSIYSLSINKHFPHFKKVMSKIKITSSS